MLNVDLIETELPDWTVVILPVLLILLMLFLVLILFIYHVVAGVDVDSVPGVKS